MFSVIIGSIRENVFTTAFVDQDLVNIISNQPIDGELSFIDWENKSIAW